MLGVCLVGASSGVTGRAVCREPSSDDAAAAPHPPSVSRSTSEELVEETVAEAARLRDEAMAAIQAERGETTHEACCCGSV
jgi:hypothetical protein